ncbi:hypothetical protein E05_51830 (plasmid) [Plautia stali symbiont]|nr:hypothetical protein E05_51830 [Plautia stali symbiont]
MGRKNFTKFPSRFPVFYRSVEQINVTQHRAFSSVRVEGEFVTVKTYTDVKDIPPDLEKLRTAGFTPEVLDDVLFKSLVIPVTKLHELAGVDRIQARRQTGVQYRATVRHARLDGDRLGQRSGSGISGARSAPVSLTCRRWP